MSNKNKRDRTPFTDRGMIQTKKAFEPDLFENKDTRSKEVLIKEEELYLTVIANSLNIRAEASQTSNILGSVVFGTKLTILSTNQFGGFFKVRSIYGDGFVKAEFVAIDPVFIQETISSKQEPVEIEPQETLDTQESLTDTEE